MIAALVVATLVIVAALWADRMASRRRRGGDRGDFWTRALFRLVASLAPLLLLSAGLEQLAPPWWHSGKHLFLDLTGAFGWSSVLCFGVALGLPLTLFLGLLAYGLIEKPGGRATGRWLAGSISSSASRAWVLAFALPLVLVAASRLHRLGEGPGGYPAAVWSTLVAASLCLVGIAFSRGGSPAAVVAHETPKLDPAASLRKAWPEAMAAHGIDLERLASWPASGPAREVRGEPARAFGESLRRLGAREVAPELIEGLSSLAALPRTAEARDLHRLVFAPEGCGQVEAVALAAQLVGRRYHATTLVITARGAAELAAELSAWLPHANPAVAIDRRGELPPQGRVWVVEAAVLSDHLLAQLKDRQRVRRIGLLVWWSVEAYTGVLAANLWAISRRLDRLVRAGGRHDVRVLAFARSAPRADARLAAFIRQLLPHSFPTESEIHVERRTPRAVEVYQLSGHREHFARGEGSTISPRLRFLPLVSAKVSVEADWPTHLTIPPEVDSSEARAFLQLTSGGQTLEERLVPRRSEAAVSIRPLALGEVLALPELLAQGGRAAPGGAPHYVGLTVPDDPYARHLLESPNRGPGVDMDSPRSRRLLCAHAHPTLLRRHLLLALNERPDTRQGLLTTFLWQEAEIQKTLQEIASDRQLQREEVRYLDPRGRLVIDHTFTSLRPPAGALQPLDTVGVRLVTVRETAASSDSEAGVRMVVDPERLTIQAYPGKIFHHSGRRFRIRDWSSVAQVRQAGTLACEREESPGRTWRIRHSSVFDLKPLEAAIGIGRQQRLLAKVRTDLRYEEEVVGVLRLTPDLTTGRFPAPESRRLAQPIALHFPTRGLVLRFPEERDRFALASLAQALRHVLPVHLGVEDEALEVVPLIGVRMPLTADSLEAEPVWGLALVDLYPGGIGLIDAFGDDDVLLVSLLEAAASWLVACPCRSEVGCPSCLRSPAALAANSDHPPQRSAALGLLRQIL